MANAAKLLSIIVILSAALVIKAQVGLDENCLGCICEASTNCTVNAGCVGGHFCGPFRLSNAYWIDAGQPVSRNSNPTARGAFENCALDLECAVSTVRAYMAKFSQDCDANGVVTCSDYMRIHKLGGYGCAGNIVDTEFTKYYNICARSFGLN